MKKYVVYQRVSTEEQANEGYSLNAMLEKCKHYIASQEGAELVRIYEDAGFSGTLPPSKRPALNQLLTDVKEKKDFTAVLCWKIDRLARNLRDMMNLEHLLRKLNVDLESVTEKIDTSSPSGRVLFSVISAFSEFESSQNAARTYNAMSSKVGQIHLGGYAPIGYKMVGGRMEIDPEKSVTVELLFKKFLTLKSMNQVAQYLNKSGLFTSNKKLWSHKTVKAVIVNPAYLGVRVWGRVHGRTRRANPVERWIVRPQNFSNPLAEGSCFKKF